jgi:hypothetical protein
VENAPDLSTTCGWPLAQEAPTGYLATLARPPAACLLKDFVVVKTFSRYHVENPSQQEKFTVNRDVIAVCGAGAAAIAGGTLRRMRQ